MTKAEKAKLHRALTDINKLLASVRNELKTIKGVQKLQGNVINVLDTDVRNLFHVVSETQQQQRSSIPSLRVVKSGPGTKTTPRPNR